MTDPHRIQKPASTPDTAPAENILVRGRFIRLFHWSLVMTFTLSWLAADTLDKLHEWAGYAAAFLIGLRIIWGVAGPDEHARFVTFVPAPNRFVRYVRALIHGREHPTLHYNPAGAVMIMLLLTGVIMLALTGYMMETDRFWGIAWVANLHEGIANVMLVLIALHLAGVIYTSWHHGENLVRTMITGYKRRPGKDEP